MVWPHVRVRVRACALLAPAIRGLAVAEKEDEYIETMSDARQQQQNQPSEDTYLKIYDTAYAGLKTANIAARPGIKLPPKYDKKFPPDAESEDDYDREMGSRRRLRETLVDRLDSTAEAPMSAKVRQMAIEGRRARSAANYGSADIRAGSYRPLPPNWDMHTEESGRPYFVDHNTFTTQLEDPRPLPIHWEQKISPDGWAYFVDHLGKKSYWIHPCATELPSPDWQQLYDADSKLYYVNHATKQTTYTKPAAVQDNGPSPSAPPPSARPPMGPPGGGPMAGPGGGFTFVPGKTTGGDAVYSEPSDAGPPKVVTTPGTVVADATDCILSYLDGNDDMGRSVTDRVKEFDRLLKRCGFKTWLHTGNEGDKIKDVIDGTMVFVIFVTRRYMDRLRDNTYKADFEYAMSKMGSVSSRRCVPVIMEPGMMVTTHWEGPLKSLRHSRTMAKLPDCSGSTAKEIKQIVDAIMGFVPPDRASAFRLDSLPSPDSAGAGSEMGSYNASSLSSSVASSHYAIDLTNADPPLFVPGQHTAHSPDPPAPVSRFSSATTTLGPRSPAGSLRGSAGSSVLGGRQLSMGTESSYGASGGGSVSYAQPHTHGGYDMPNRHSMAAPGHPAQPAPRQPMQAAPRRPGGGQPTMPAPTPRPGGQFAREFPSPAFPSSLARGLVGAVGV